MPEHVDQSNAVDHCKELHKVLLNASMMSVLSGRPRSRWSVAELGQVFDVVWGVRKWRYGTVDIIRMMKSLQDLGLVQIETGFLGRIKAYRLTQRSLDLLDPIADKQVETEDAGVKQYKDWIRKTVALNKSTEEVPFIAAGFYRNAILGMLQRTPERCVGNSIALDLIAVGGDPLCVLTALTQAFAAVMPVYQKSSIQVEKELAELGSAEAFMEALQKFHEQYPAGSAG